MRSGPWRVERLLKMAMVLTGAVLLAALAKPLLRYQTEFAAQFVMKEEGRNWKYRAAELLADFFRRDEEEDLFAGWWNPNSKTESERQPDPAYAEYERRQKVLSEAAWMFLLGDETKGSEAAEEPVKTAEIEPAASGSMIPGTTYMLEQLQDYDFLINHFYTVHASTTAKREEMDAAVLTGLDLSIKKDSSVPQILIYHTHSQETYADYEKGNKKATVVELGNELTRLLEEKGYQVIHDTSSYDMAGGKLDRNHAYNYALDGIMGILQKYPTIQVVLDVHRDGVKESLHIVRTVNGKNMAPIMFFNGMSQTPEGAIEYLPNPYKTENLAFSLQMQLRAESQYPGLTRKIFLKGLRYNLHVRPRSVLIEVGAQTNTMEEALGAMEPLADLLDQVLSQKKEP